jgi:hypothetical protein
MNGSKKAVFAAKKEQNGFSSVIGKTYRSVI